MYQDTDSSRRVAYFYNYQIGKFHYGKEHPMKPKRIAMAHNLIVNLGLYRNLDVYLCREATKKEMLKFHDPDYINYLSQYVSSAKDILLQDIVIQNKPSNTFTSHLVSEFDLLNYNNQSIVKTDVNEPVIKDFRDGESSDCPAFPGLFTFCQLSTGASLDAAHLLLNHEADICINYSGGLHHAKKKEASGFCYVNDIVLCILELLRGFTRVLYVDIDVHHGDGVEEAFFLTNRVMTLSFHQYGDDFYPGSGNIDTVGEGLGRYYALNVPLRIGMNDECFVQLFKSVVQRVLDVFRPEAVVLQTGTDSLSYDKLGGFNLSIRGHGECVEFMKGKNIPMIILGGGGYTIQNVARCWAYETGICLNRKIDQQIPIEDIYYEHYGPDYKLHYPIKQNVENKNKKEEIFVLEETIFEYLRRIEFAPGVSFHDVPIDLFAGMEIEVDENDNEKSLTLHQFDGGIRERDPIGREMYVDLGNGINIHKKQNE